MTTSNCDACGEPGMHESLLGCVTALQRHLDEQRATIEFLTAELLAAQATLRRMEGHVVPAFTLDGEPVNITQFLADNAHDEYVNADDIRALKVGERIVYGGGAAATFILQRVA